MGRGGVALQSARRAGAALADAVHLRDTARGRTTGDTSPGRAGRTSRHRSEAADDARAGSGRDDARPAGARYRRGGEGPAGVISSGGTARNGVWRNSEGDDRDGARCASRRAPAARSDPQTTAASDANVIGAWVRRDCRGSGPHTEPLSRQVRHAVQGSRRHRRGVRRAHRQEHRRKRGEAALGDCDAAGHEDDTRISRGIGVDRHPLAARIQDPGAARIQLTVRSIDEVFEALRSAGPSTVVSTGGGIITQPQYRVAVVSDLNGLFLVLTDRRPAAAK